MAIADYSAPLLARQDAESEQELLNASPVRLEVMGLRLSSQAVIHEALEQFETRLEFKKA